MTSEGSGSATIRRLGKRLVVASFAKKKKRTKESSVEDKLASALFAHDAWNTHVSMKEGGWPDRYVRGGIWIEVKSLHELGVQHQLEVEQIRHLDELTKAGDKCFYFAKFEDKLFCVPWIEFKAAKLAPINCTPYAYKDIGEVVRHVILET